MATSTLEIHIQELDAWFRQETERVLSPLRKDAGKLLDTLKARLEDMKTACKTAMTEADEEVKVGKKPRKARAMYKLSKYFLQTSETVTAPDEVSFESLTKLDSELGRLLTSIARQRAIWYPLISPMFIISRRKIDLAFEKTAQTARELHAFLTDKYSKAREVEETLTRIRNTQKLCFELAQIQAERDQAELIIKQLDERIGEAERQVENIQNKPELAELATAENRIKELDKTVKHHLRHLQKPFKKLQQLMQNTREGSVGINLQKLDDYLAKPLVALATEDENYPVLRRILQELSTILSQEKLKLKPTRVRKAQEAITWIINESALDQLQLECKQALKHLQTLQSSETIAKTKNEHLQLCENLNDLQRQREIETSKQATRKSKHEEKLRETLTQKTEIEKNILKVTGRHVKIAL